MHHTVRKKLLHKTSENAYRPAKSTHVKKLLQDTWVEVLGRILFKVIVLPNLKAETLAD